MNSRLKNIQNIFKKNSISAILVSSPENIGYFSGQFHFSHTEREAFMLITSKKTYFFTDSRFSGMLTLDPKISFIETSARSGVYDEIKKIAKKEQLHTIGYEENNLTVLEYTTLKKAVNTQVKLTTINNIFTAIRMVKDMDEIKAIRKACAITDTAFKYIQPFIRLGVTEIELADRLDNFFKRSNAASAFPPIVAFGKHAAIPHHMPKNTPLTSSDHYILFDFGAKYNQYCADLSRTIFFGELSDDLRNQYNAVLKAQELSLKSLNSESRSGKLVDAAARDYLKECFFEVPHAVGHGLGLSIHEFPSISPLSTSLLSKNMVITIEPGIYLENAGGIRIEDTVLVTEKGFTVLTKSSKDIIHLS